MNICLFSFLFFFYFFPISPGVPWKSFPLVTLIRSLSSICCLWWVTQFLHKHPGADPGFWNGGWIFSPSIREVREIKYYFNIWGIRKKKKERKGWKFTHFTSAGSAPVICSCTKTPDKSRCVPPVKPLCTFIDICKQCQSSTRLCSVGCLRWFLSRLCYGVRMNVFRPPPYAVHSTPSTS